MKRTTFAFILAILVLVTGCVTTSAPSNATLTKEQSVPVRTVGRISTIFFSVPAVIDGKTYQLETRLTYPDSYSEAPEKHPVVVLTHGRNGPSPERNPNTSKGYGSLTMALAQQGYPSIYVVRRGYGNSDGPDSEFLPSPEASAFAGAKDLTAVVDYLKTIPWVDTNKVMIMGHSQGGWVALGSSAMNIPGVVGAVNISGATNYQGQSNNAKDYRTESRLEQSVVVFAKNQKVPTLWLYASNDNHSTPVVSGWFKTYQSAGGKGTLLFTPNYMGSNGNGHSVVNNPNYYLTEVLVWFKEIGFVPRNLSLQG